MARLLRVKDPQLFRQLRDEAGCSQKHLADHVKVSQAAISLIELGKRNVSDEKGRKIAHHLRVTVDSLFGPAPPRLRRISPTPNDDDGGADAA